MVVVAVATGNQLVLVHLDRRWIRWWWWICQSPPGGGLVEPMVMLAVMELDQDPRLVEAVVALQRQKYSLKDMVEMDHQMFIDMDQLIQ